MVFGTDYPIVNHKKGGINIRQIIDDLFVQQSRIWQLNSVVWLTGNPAVLDPAYFPDEIASISDFIAGKGKSTVVFSHGDFDHVVGAPYFPASPVVAQEEYKNTGIKEQLKQLRETDQAYNIERGIFTYPQAGIVFRDKLEIDLGGRPLMLIRTPGHTADSIVAVDSERHVLAAGDMVSDIEFPFIYHSAYDYLLSLKKLEGLVEDYDINIIIPGHGALARGKQEIRARLQADILYLEELVGRITDLDNAGLPENEIKTVMAEMKYKGEFAGGLMKAHMENVDKVLQEV